MLTSLFLLNQIKNTMLRPELENPAAFLTKEKLIMKPLQLGFPTPPPGQIFLPLLLIQTETLTHR